MEMSLEDVDFVLLLRLSQICDSMECVLRMVILSYCGDYSRQAPTWTGLLEMTVWFCVLLLRVGRCQQTPLETIYFHSFLFVTNCNFRSVRFNSLYCSRAEESFRLDF